MKMKALLLLCIGLLFAARAWATPFSAMYTFGDSLSDAGNSPSAVLSLYGLIGTCDAYHSCPPYVDGHFSNGPTAAEYLANRVVDGGSANYFSFAVGGASTGIGNIADAGTPVSIGSYGLPGIAQELARYNQLSGGAADPNALYLVWGGANDFSSGGSPIDAASNIATYVALLASMGATHILVPNLPDLGLTPEIRSLNLSAAGSLFSLLFNTELSRQLDQLERSLSSDIIQFDVYSLLNAVIANPLKYGFNNAQDACLAATNCDPAEYVFWDGIHPTTKGHALIATAFANAVPEPASILLLALGLLALRTRTPKRTKAGHVGTAGHLRPMTGS